MESVLCIQETLGWILAPKYQNEMNVACYCLFLLYPRTCFNQFKEQHMHIQWMSAPVFAYVVPQTLFSSCELKGLAGGWVSAKDAISL